jgi:hypothetical protein
MMKISSTEWAELVPRIVENQDNTQHEIDIKLKNVFWAIDGMRTLGEIATEGMYEPTVLIDLVKQLMDMGLVVIGQGTKKVIDSGFFDFLSDLLKKELGPMGEIVLEDAVATLGFGKSNFPENSMPKLINLLAADMGDASKADSFKATVGAELQKRK